MDLIDAHVHLYPEAVNRDPAAWAAAHGEAHWAELCTRRRKDGRPVQAFPSLEQLVQDMDAGGIRRAVLLGWYWENFSTCREFNRFYASCVRAHPLRLTAFAALHPVAGTQVLDEMRRARDAGFAGFGELSPHAQHVRLDDPIWQKMLALAGELGMPVNLHVTDPTSKPYPGRMDTPLEYFIGLAKDFPGTNFILAHWGGGLAWSEATAGLRNVWYDTAASPLLYGPEVWQKGPLGRVLFGSDYPLVLYPKTGAGADFRGIVQEAKSAGAEESIFRVNAATLLGLG